MSTGLLLADYGIRQLYGRYADAVWRKDCSLFVECFATDAEWKIAAMHLKGRDAIGATFTRLVGRSERVMMFCGLPVLEISDGTATGRVHITELAKRLDGSSARSIGVYYDRYVGAGTDWRFKSRFWALAHSGPADWSAPFLPCPDYGPHPAMPGEDEQAPAPGL